MYVDCSEHGNVQSTYIISQYGGHGIDCITYMIRLSRLRWFGHVERKDSDDLVSACRHFKVNGVRNRVRGRKAWDECMKKDLIKLGLHR